MRTIKLKLMHSEILVRVNPDHVVSYWNADTTDGGCEIHLTIGDVNQGLLVKETADDIDKLLSELP